MNKNLRLTETWQKIQTFLQENSPFEIDDLHFQYTISELLADLPTTNEGNAMRTIARCGHGVLYVYEQKDFFSWSGKYWEKGRGCEIRAACKTANYLAMEAARVAESGDKKRSMELLKWCHSSQSWGHVSGVANFLKNQPEISISRSDFDKREWLFNLENGTLDLQTGKLNPHNSTDLITKIAPISYDPEAECPKWEEFILKICSLNEGMIRFIQQLCGCGLVGKQMDDILAIGYGPGGNGKTVFAETVRFVLGDYVGLATSDLFLSKVGDGPSNDRACLSGTRFLTASETDEGRRLNEALVKGMTGGDKQQVRFLYGEFFELVPQFTPILFTNHRPIINGTDKGIWRRVRLMPWLWDFEHDDGRKPKYVVYEELRAEAQGIFNWMLAGLQDRMQSAEIFYPDEIREQTESYRRHSDTLGEFLEDFCWTKDMHAEITKKDLYEAYRKFAEEAGNSNISTAKGFTMKLLERTDIPFLGEKRTSSARYWTGIRLRNEFDPVEGSDDKKDEEPF
jgi:putative DNA primase/helicase